MTLKLRCEDYGFECEYTLEEEKSIGLIEKLRDHFEAEHDNRFSTSETRREACQVTVSKHHLRGGDQTNQMN